MNFAFKDIHQFNNFFKGEAACYKFYEEQHRAGFPVYPHCGSIKTPYKVKAHGKFQDIPFYRCAEKGFELLFTVRTGTIFEGSKVEMHGPPGTSPAGDEVLGDTEVPAGDNKIPAADTKVPAGDNKVPTADTEVPEIGIVAPAADTDVPDDDN